MISAVPSARMTAARLAPASISSAVTVFGASPPTSAISIVFTRSVWKGVPVEPSTLTTVPQVTAESTVSVAA
jgi:hypothetical protein